MDRTGVTRARTTVRVTGRGVLVGALAVSGLWLMPAVAAYAAGGTFNVTTTGDIAANAGACGNTGITTPPSPLSLRESICLANNVGGAVTINVPAGNFTLASGELKVGLTPGQAVDIVGAGSARTIIDGDAKSRVLNFDPNQVGGVGAGLTGLTVTNGADSNVGGAGIVAGAGSRPTGDNMTMTDVVVSNNRANDGAPTRGNRPGGGMQFSGGRLTVTNSVFSGNTSNSSSGAGLYYRQVGTAPNQALIVDGTTFSGNSMTNANTSSGVGNGGALAVQGTTGVYSVTDSRFVNNTVAATTGPARGAAILAVSGNLTVTGSTFTGNSVSGGTTNSSAGGAVSLAAAEVVATLNYNRFVGNSAPTGSAISDITSGGADSRFNWFGCNGGPGADGCDTVAGGGDTDPYLQLSAAANPGTVTGPNGTSTISALFTRDSAGGTVSSANLGAFDGATATFADPPGDSTVTNSAGAKAVAFGTGRADIDYHSGTVAGPNPVNVTFDNQTVTATPTVNQRPAITSPDTATFDTNQQGVFTVTTTGYPTPAVTESGTLPNGLTFTDNGDGTATIAGAPSGAGGSFPINLTASNGASPNATQTLTLTVGGPPAFTSGNTATFRRGQSGSYTVTTSGNPTVDTITETGALPAGLTFTDNGDGTATLAGRPTSAGTSSITLRASNGTPPDATQTLTIQVNDAPAITLDPANQAVRSGTSVSFIASASGVPTPSVQWQRDTGSGFGNINGATAATYTFTATAGDDGNRYRAVFINSVDTATTTAATLTVGTAPAFTSADHASFVVGQQGSFTVDTTGMPKAALTRTGAQFPSWLTLTDKGDGTGTLAGTPPRGSGGAYQFTLEADNTFAPVATQTFTLSVDEAPTITSTDHATFVAGRNNSFTVATDAGFPTATAIGENGPLPSGVSLTDNGDGTATLAGKPATGTGGTYSLTINAEASGGQADPAHQAFTLTVNEAPRITSADHATFAVGIAGSFTVTTADANPPATDLDVTGTLPAGLTFTDNGHGTATIAGTPNAGAGRVYTLSISATNGVAQGDTQLFTLTVNEPARITSTNHATFVRDTAAAFTVTTTAGQPAAVTITEVGGLPAGITFTDNGDGTATLAGRPTEGGTFALTLRASNGVQPDATQSFTLTVNAPSAITSADHATFTAGDAASFTVTTTDGTPAATTLFESGALPAGVTFTDNGDGTASFAGTPDAGSGGSYPLTLTAANGVSPNATQPFTLTVDEAPRITSAATASFAIDAQQSFTVTTAHSFPEAVTLTLTGALPLGVHFADNHDGTATLSGTPRMSGTYPVTISAANGVAPDATQPFVFVVTTSPQITSADHATFSLGTPGAFTVTTSPGVPDVTAITESGALPGGVDFVDNGDGTATLSGRPTASGSFPITITGSNQATPNAVQQFSLTVTDLPAITSPNTGALTVGVSGTITVTTKAGFPTTTPLTEAGTLPSGVSFIDNGNGTASITGTPAAGTGGSYPVTLTAGNTAGGTVDQAFTLTVYESTAITSADHATFTAGDAGSFTVTTAGGFPTPPALTSVGALPTGVTFADNGDGTATLAGTPTAGGVYPVTITAGNTKSADAGQSFTLTVNGPPTITSSAGATLTEGVAGSVTVTTRAGLPAATSLTSTGVLPRGVTFTDHHDGTATIAGTATQHDVFPLALTASNGIAPDGVQAFTLTVVQAKVVPLVPVLPASGGTLSGVPATTTPGQVLHLRGTGFAAGAPVTIGLYPSRTVLARVVADSSGAFTATIVVPARLGKQTFVAAGMDDTNDPQFLQAKSMVSADAAAGGSGGSGSGGRTGKSSGGGGSHAGSGAGSGSTGAGSTGLASTGASVDPRLAGGAAVGLLLFGLVLVVIARRRGIAGRHRSEG